LRDYSAKKNSWADSARQRILESYEADGSTWIMAATCPALLSN